MRGVVRQMCVMAAGLGLVGAVTAAAPAKVAGHGPSAPLAAGSARAWRVVYWARSASVHVASIAAPGKRDAWAVGTYRNARGQQRPLVLHWDGARWARYAVPGLRPGCAPYEVAAPSPADVWIFCDQDSGDPIHRWDGRSWHLVPAQPGGGVSGAVVLSATDAWAPGAQTCPGGVCTATIWQWDGAAWAPRPIGIQVEWSLAGAGTQVAVIGCNSEALYCRPSAFRWTGARWQAIPGPYHRRTVDPTIAVSPSGELWIQSLPPRRGPVILYQRRSGAWRTIVAPDHLSGLPMAYDSALSYDGREGVWSAATAHWTGRHWINAILVALPHFPYQYPEPASMSDSIAPIPGTTSTWGLGNGSPCRTSLCPQDFIAVFGRLP